MKRTITIITIALTSFSVNAQFLIDSVYYYNPDGSKNWWFIQEDVFSFRCIGGNAYGGSYNPSVVGESEYSPYSFRQQTTFKFRANSSETDRILEKNNVTFYQEFEYQTLTVTKDKNSFNDYTKDEFVLTNDLILVNFIDPEILQTDVDDFMTRYELLPFHQPSSSLPTSSWTYGFKLDPNISILSPIFGMNTFDAAKTIFIAEQGLIKSCIPDMKLAKPDGGHSNELNDDEEIAADDNQAISNKEIIVFPNPIVNQLTIHLPNAPEINNLELKIYNDIGVCVFSSVIENQKLFLINTDKLVKGMYTFNVFLDGSLFQRGRVVK